ncbi:hypothetical protein TTHERM_000844740 (macronuclear) [Tetrahymena thermophila SB210]|uniref:Uncharacterized protein n=1 Tax=Tetrahymena thermophila (strain SB210) TaxID=312017 RepID=W7XJY2_TETTS|nr:hypothetical protein TTHERM_000844740 [Tetrahymena thermophila SB210]EWS76051.1 hypothetical protein TTHERM_000844740 [Tetrahymena thermophila SB210]|eukprot:XP_012651402.1 hypothetical protein TTHERM_000844740 [Tetrahymena thermophila SB210]
MIDTQLISINKFDIFKNIRVLCISFLQILQVAKQPIKKINLNKYVDYNPLDLKEYYYDYAVSNFIIKINGQTLNYMDMSYPFFSYTSMSFSDNISQVEPVSNSNSLLLIRFKNDKYSAALLDGHANTQFQINGNINTLMYFQNYIMFLQKPYNQLLVLKVSNPIISNTFFVYDNDYVYCSETQQLLGSPNGDIIEIQYYKDGSKKVFQSNHLLKLKIYFNYYFFYRQSKKFNNLISQIILKILIYMLKFKYNKME